jgi:hypothetical protein
VLPADIVSGGPATSRLAEVRNPVNPAEDSPAAGSLVVDNLAAGSPVVVDNPVEAGLDIRAGQRTAVAHCNRVAFGSTLPPVVAWLLELPAIERRHLGV